MGRGEFKRNNRYKGMCVASQTMRLGKMRNEKEREERRKRLSIIRSSNSLLCVL